MKFMIIARASAESETGALPGAELFEAMLDFNEVLAKAGMLIAAEGLHPSSEGACTSYTAGKPTVIDGPFETREVVAAGHGYAREAAAWPGGEGFAVLVGTHPGPDGRAAATTAAARVRVDHRRRRRALAWPPPAASLRCRAL
jgi:YCII-related domain